MSGWGAEFAFRFNPGPAISRYITVAARSTPTHPMIRDLSFDEMERADGKRRLLRLVVICLLVSSLGSFAVAREMRIREEFEEIPTARIGDLGSLRARHDAIASMLDEHHVWAGAFQARRELDELVVTIADEERAAGEAAARREAEETRIREEAQAARTRGMALVERKQYSLALTQFKKALDLCDSLSEAAWGGAPWEHREQLVVDIYALENVSEGAR